MNGRILVTNNGSDTLSIFDPSTSMVMGAIPVGLIPVELEGPHHLSADPKGHYIFVNLSEAVAGSGGGPHGAHGTGTTDGFVLKLSAVDGHLVTMAEVDPNPGDNTISPDGTTVYVSHYDLIKWSKIPITHDAPGGYSGLAVLDAATMNPKTPEGKTVPICPAAHGARLSADAKTLYVTCGPDEIAVVDVSSPTFPSKRVPFTSATSELTGGCDHCPYALQVAPDGYVWVSSLGPSGGGMGMGDIRVYDPQTEMFDQSRTVDLDGRAMFAAFSHGTPFKVYVPEQAGLGDGVRIYMPGGPGQAPTEVGHILFTRAQCENPHMMLLSTDDTKGYLVCEGDHVNTPGTFVVLDLTMNTVLSTMPLQMFPDGLALVPPASP
jgi:YVTN family beta-propeller protein